MKLALVLQKSSHILVQRHPFASLNPVKRKISVQSLVGAQGNSSSETTKKEKKLNEDDWFNKILKPKKNHLSPDVNKESDDYYYIGKKSRKFKDMDTEERKKYIEWYYESCKESGIVVPKQLDDKDLDLLMRCESFSHLKKTMG